jgi:ribosome-associated protein
MPDPIYPPTPTTVDLPDQGVLKPFPEESRELAMLAAQAADDRKGANILILQVTEVSYLSDYFVIITGFSRVQVRAIANTIRDKIEQQLRRTPRQIEGLSEGIWVLLDYGDVIVHVLLPQERDFYNLEAFWGHAEQIPFTPTPAPLVKSPDQG